MTGEVDIEDPRWFPVDLDVSRQEVHFALLDEAVIEQSTFIDSRLDLTGLPTAVIPIRELTGLVTRVAPAWLWHTSFCGSTLFARMLHVAPYSISLREPLVLRRLSDAVAFGGEISAFIQPILALLARSWHRGGRTVIKPTHAALNIADALMAAEPSSRAIVLTSSLDDFLVSHLKKTPQTLERIPLLAERSLRAGSFAKRLAQEAFHPPSPLAAAALQWAAQRELLAEIRDRMPDRIRVLDWERAQADLAATLQECSSWLQLELPAQELAANVAKQAQRHAKAPGEAYGLSKRREEIMWLRARYGQSVDQAQTWAESHVLPKMRADAIEV